MTLQSFNSFLLATIVKNFRMGLDPQSLLKRHQTLSIIYVNVSLILMIVFYEIGSIYLGIPYHNVPTVAVPLMAVSMWCLRNGKNDISALMALFYAHGANFYISHYRNSSIGSLTAIFMFPNFSFFMSSSNKVHYINMSLCMLQVFGHIRIIMNVFRLTLSVEQEEEITHLIAVAIPCFIFLCLSFVAQKSVEKSIWQAVSMTQEKNEKINREIMQAVESKDAFISSLSHEIRNPLNAMNGSINYLLQVVNDPQLQQVLQNARISGETLLNLFTNLLDAAKLKSDKMELSYDDTNIFETLKKVLIINCENIKQKRLSVDAFVDQNIPQIIQSDSARLLQILMNLMSNAIKFTSEGGKIVITATLCHKDASKEELEAQLIVPNNNENNETNFSPVRSKQRRQTQPIVTSLQFEDESLLTEEFNQEEARVRRENLKSISSIRNIEGYIPNPNSARQSYSNINRNQPWNIQKIDMSSGKQKSSSRGGVDQISLEPGRKDDKDYFIKIQVTDTGCGIAEENISKLFEMFTQAHKRVTSSHGGTGLGLWLCKQLCQKMGGDIRLYSKINEGTSFVFYLPVSDRGILETQVSQSEISAGQYNEKTSCLIVDDFSYNRDLYKLLLEREGVQVVLACDGEEAINKYLANLEKIDFILMDVQMPKMDGFTAAKKIRELESINIWRRVDIYFVSGEYYNEEEVMASFKTQEGQDGKRLGIQSLKKPIDIDVISKVAAKYTKKGR